MTEIAFSPAAGYSGEMKIVAGFRPTGPQRLTIPGVGTFTPRGGSWTYTPDPTLTPDEAATNLIAAIERLTEDRAI